MNRRRRMRGVLVLAGLVAIWTAAVGPAFAVLGSPTLYSPTNGARVNGTSITFIWYPLSGAYNYLFQISPNSNFTTPVSSHFTGGPSNFTVTGLRDNGSALYWRVVGVDAFGQLGLVSSTWLVINGPSGLPGVPIPISPANNSVVNGYKIDGVVYIDFTWERPIGAADYHLQVAVDSAFAYKVFDNLAGGDYTGVPLGGFPDNGYDYYWRVRGKNPLGFGTWSATWYFINGPSGPATVPILTSPVDGAFVGTTEVTLMWTAERAADNRLQVAFDSGFTQLFVDEWLGYNADVVTLLDLLNNGQRFYWRVKAWNPFGETGWSTQRSFVNGPTATPLPPTPREPADGAKVDGESVTFTWDLGQGAKEYFFQVAYDSGFTNIFFADWIDNGYVPGVRLSPFPDDGRQYHWRLKSRNSRGESGWSIVFNFINGPSQIPDAPTLYSPPAGTFVSGKVVPFDWNYAKRATDYYLQIATDSGFTNVVHGQWHGNILYADVDEFEDDYRQYHWRVRARNSVGESGWSSARTFTNGVGICQPYVGAGYGLLSTHNHIDTCYDSFSQAYFLHDISRRAGAPAGHSHQGVMPGTSYIQTRTFGGTLPRHETLRDYINLWSDPSQSSGVDAHVHAGWVYDFLNLYLGLNSFDGSGAIMKSVVESPPPVDAPRPTAFWSDLLSRVTFSGQVGTTLPFSGALDMVAHEWGHAVTHRASLRGSEPIPWNSETTTRGLFYAYESGALSDAFADWVGVMVERWNGEVNWTIGEGIKTVRDVQDPRRLEHADTYLVIPYRMTTPSNCTPSEANDNCGVHTNSGVANKMFYLLSEGGVHNDIEVQGVGVDVAFAVAYWANMNYWPHDVTFFEAMEGMLQAAVALFPEDTNLLDQIRNAWAAVYVGEAPAINTEAFPPEGGTMEGGGRYPWGSTATVTATPNPGYRFVNWTQDGVEVSREAAYTFTVNADRWLIANFMALDHSISATPSSHDFGARFIEQSSSPVAFTIGNTGGGQLLIGSVLLAGANASDFALSADTCTGASLALNQSCTVHAVFTPLSAGAKSASISIPSNDPDTPLLNVPLSGTGVVPPTFTLTASAELGGTISPSGAIQVIYGGSQTFTIAADFGFSIFDVLVDGASVGPRSSYTFSNVAANHTISARFVLLGYVITASTPGGGSISPSGSVTVDHGSNQTFTITPNTGNIISAVRVDGVSVGTPTIYTFTNVTASHTIQAIFSSRLTVVKAGTGAGTVTSSPAGISCGSDCVENYAYGTAVTLSAAASPGSVFAGWSGSGCSGTGTCAVTMNASKSVTATFSDATPPSTTATPPGGSYTYFAWVALTCSDTGSGCDRIYYTKDGTTPTVSSPVYLEPIQVATTTTLKYFARDWAGNSEAVKTQLYTLPPATGATLTSPYSADYVGAVVTFTATGSGGSGAYEYQFYIRQQGGGSWTIVQAYSPYNLWAWYTAAYTAGGYDIKVEVRNLGSSVPYEATASKSYSLLTGGGAGSGDGGGKKRRN